MWPTVHTAPYKATEADSSVSQCSLTHIGVFDVNTNPQVIDTIAKAHFLASHAQVEQRPSLSFRGKRGGNTYTAVVLAYVKDALPKRSKPAKRAALKAIDKVHKDLYPHVLKGITAADDTLTDQQRNSRATFARTA